MSIERKADDIARAFLLERHLFENGRQQEFAGEVVGVIGAGAFIAFGDGFEGMLPSAGCAATGGSSTSSRPRSSARARSAASASATRATVQVVGVDTARGRVDLSPVELKT